MSNVPGYRAKNFEFVGYHDLDDNPGFKMAIHEVGGKWYLYIADFWRPYITVMDVTDPANPKKVNEFMGCDPKSKKSILWNLLLGNGLLIISNEPMPDGWCKPEDIDAPFDEGFTIYDIKEDPVHPKKLSMWHTGFRGTHRNFFTGDNYVHCTAKMKGYSGFIYVIVDISDVYAPKEVGRWFVPQQFASGGGVMEHEGDNCLHGPAYIQGDRAFLSYGQCGAIILDVSDYTDPKIISRIHLGNAIGNILGVHTYQPIKTRGLAIVSGEAFTENSSEPMTFAALADITNEKQPRMLSFFPTPEPEPDAPYKNFHTRGGRFGPHNWNMYQEHNPNVAYNDTILLNAWFNAGLRAFDTTDPYLPKEVGFFLPDDPKKRNGCMPVTLTTSSEDLLIDVRGNCYLTDKNHGLFIVKYTGPGKLF